MISQSSRAVFLIVVFSPTNFLKRLHCVPYCIGSFAPVLWLGLCWNWVLSPGFSSPRLIFNGNLITDIRSKLSHSSLFSNVCINPHFQMAAQWLLLLSRDHYILNDVLGLCGNFSVCYRVLLCLCSCLQQGTCQICLIWDLHFWNLDYCH